VEVDIELVEVDDAVLAGVGLACDEAVDQAR